MGIGACRSPGVPRLGAYVCNSVHAKAACVFECIWTLRTRQATSKPSELLLKPTPGPKAYVRSRAWYDRGAAWAPLSFTDVNPFCTNRAAQHRVPAEAAQRPQDRRQFTIWFCAYTRTESRRRRA